MTVRLVTSLREFDALAPVWQEVTTAGGQGSPFLSHDWFACCWRTAGPARRRELWIVEDAAGPVALVPLVRWRTLVRGLPVRMVAVLDSPDTPFVDLPMARPPAEVVPAFLEALRARRDWDVLCLRKVPAASPTLAALRGALAGRLPWHEVGRELSPYVDVVGDWDRFLGNRSPRFRKTLRNVENRLQRAGTVEVEEHRTVDPDGGVFAEAMEISRASWKGPRGLAMASMEGMPRFFREFTRRASDNGWLRLWLLRVDGRAVASEYQVVGHRTVHALRADFVESAGELSPGAALSARILQGLFAEGAVREYDMGPGGNPYKLRFATGAHEAVALQVYAPTPYGRMLHRIETRLVPLLRRLRGATRAACA